MRKFSLFNLIKKRKLQPVKINTCTTCRFNQDITCYAGTYYAAKGENKICYNGELWEQK